MNGYRPAPNWLPTLGCLLILMVLALILLMPLILVDVMRAALLRLHLTRSTAALSVIGIFFGSLFNIPVWRIAREGLQPMVVAPMFGSWYPAPLWQQQRQDTVIAVNVGGCVIPTLLAGWQVLHLVQTGGWPLTAAAIVAAVNVFVCFRLARPAPGVGILLPGFAAALTAVGVTWLLLSGADYAAYRPAAAFVAGVLGPLIGADLLHLRDITRVPVGMLSIGGAGTFDGIVLSGFLAALLA